LENDRVVTAEEGRALAEEYGVQFFETSALTGYNVEAMFTDLATIIKRKRIDELEARGGDSGSVSVADQSQAGTVRLGENHGGAAAGGAGRSFGNCCG
jgi:hypothetical protein